LVCVRDLVKHHFSQVFRLSAPIRTDLVDGLKVRPAIGTGRGIRSDLWFIPRPRRIASIHIEASELVEQAVTNSSKIGDIVLDTLPARDNSDSVRAPAAKGASD
jgi:hypothetical protein